MPAAMCAYSYPQDLASFAYALDGTVVDWSIEPKGPPNEGSELNTLALHLEVNEAFSGELADRFTLYAFGGRERSGRDGSELVGQRFLVATGPTQEQVVCGGFTRSYEVDAADEWRALLKRH